MKEDDGEKNKDEKYDTSFYGLSNYGVQRYSCHEHCPLCLWNPGHPPAG